MRRLLRYFRDVGRELRVALRAAAELRPLIDAAAEIDALMARVDRLQADGVIDAAQARTLRRSLPGVAHTLVAELERQEKAAA